MGLFGRLFCSLFTVAAVEETTMNIVAAIGEITANTVAVDKAARQAQAQYFTLVQYHWQHPCYQLSLLTHKKS